MRQAQKSLIPFEFNPCERSIEKLKSKEKIVKVWTDVYSHSATAQVHWCQIAKSLLQIKFVILIYLKLSVFCLEYLNFLN